MDGLDWIGKGLEHGCSLGLAWRCLLIFVCTIVMIPNPPSTLYEKYKLHFCLLQKILCDVCHDHPSFLRLIVSDCRMWALWY